MEQSGSSLGS